LQALLDLVQNKPQEFVQQHTLHFEGLCRHLLSDAAALEKIRSFAADLLIPDVSPEPLD
jgi:hypothetical protein